MLSLIRVECQNGTNHYIIHQSLKKKDSLLFAPLSNVGAVSFDKDAVYIDIGRSNYTKKEDLADGDEEMEEREYDPDEPAGMLKGLQDVDSGVEKNIARTKLRLFIGSRAVESGSVDESDSDDGEVDRHTMKSRRQEDSGDDSENDDDDEDGRNLPFRMRNRDDDESDESDDSDNESSDENESDAEKDEGSDSEESDDASDSGDSESDKEGTGTRKKSTSVSWKDIIADRAAKSFLERQASIVNIQAFIYGTQNMT
jgi:ribosome biogenesis protein BMS1